MGCSCKKKREKTLLTLYRDRENEPWYWRLLGTTAPVLVLLGFLIFPASFPTTVDVTIDQATISIISVILLALGYSLSVALWFICRSWLFQLDVIFLPCFLSCVLGAVNTGVNLGVHPASSLQWTPAPISALALSIVSTSIYGILCLFTWYKIHQVRKHTHQHAQFQLDAASESATLIDEDPVKQNLGRLLSQSGRSNSGGFYSSGANNGGTNASADTYRIDFTRGTQLERSRSRGANNSNRTSRGSGGLTRSTSPYSHSEPSSTLDQSSTDYNTHSTTAGQVGSLRTAGTFDYPDAATRPLEGKAATLQAARDRAVHNARSRERMAAQQQQAKAAAGGSVGSSSLPPLPGGDLSRHHPLQRDGVLEYDQAGSEAGSSKLRNDVYPGPTYRPHSTDDGEYGRGTGTGEYGSSYGGQPQFELIEGTVEIDLAMPRAAAAARRAGEDGGIGGRQVTGELEARMPRERASVFTESEMGSYRTK